MKVIKYFRRDGDRFIKYHGTPYEDDWIRVSALHQLCENVAGLRTAKPLKIDAPNQHIIYEWLGDLPRIISLPHEEFVQAMTRLGRCLAQLHEQRTDCEALRGSAASYPLENFGISAGETQQLQQLPTGLFHGDCWHANVLLGKDGDLVIIDPIMSSWLFGPDRYVLANGALDLATVHMSLIVSHRIGRLIMLDLEKCIEAGEALLAGYLSYFNAEALKPIVLRLSRAIAITYISSYPTRINTLVGWVKRALTRRQIAKVDRMLGW